MFTTFCLGHAFVDFQKKSEIYSHPRSIIQFSNESVWESQGILEFLLKIFKFKKKCIIFIADLCFLWFLAETKD